MRSCIPVRTVRALAFAALPALLAACSGTHHERHLAAALRPAQFVVRPNIADPLCNRGRGVRLPVRIGNAVIASAAMADGSTLVAVSDYATKKSVGLYSLTRRSTLKSGGFGDRGAATITFSSRHGALPAAGSHGLWVNAVAPRRGGGAIVAGGYGDGMTRYEWVVGEVTPRGRL